MAELPVIGRASYGKFEFNSSTRTTDLRITPVPDRSGRTFTHFQVALTLKTKITGRPADRTVTNAIQQLTQPAQTLIYSGRGVGTFNISVGAGTPDLMWGPKPKLVSLRPLGAGNAVELTWSVEFATLTCADAVYQGQLMEFVWGIDYDVDASGLTKRTYRAMCRIPQTRLNPANRLLRFTVDEFREKVTPALLPGFRRTVPASVSIDEDKCGMRLTCVDDEFPSNVFPVGIVEANASHTISSEPGRLLTYIATLEGSYEVAKGTPVDAAWKPFLATLKDRVDSFLTHPLVIAGRAAAAVGGIAAGVAAGVGGGGRGRAAGVAAAAVAGAIVPIPGVAAGAGRLVAGGGAPAVSSDGPVVIPWQFTAAETQIYGKTVVRLSYSYKIVSATRDMILAAAGLWRPVPGSDWKKWAASVATHLSPRGIARLTLAPGDDKIVDLCRADIVAIDLRGGDGGFAELRPPPRGGAVPIAGGAAAAAVAANINAAAAATRGVLGPFIGPGFPGPVFDGRGGAVRGVFPAPTPEKSFVDYVCNIRVEDASGVVIATTLPTTPFTSSSSRSSDGEVFAQRRTVQTAYVVMEGYAVRAGFPVPQPALTDINGSAPVACNRPDAGEGFEQMVVGNCGVQLYFARWRMRYALVGQLPNGPLPVADNPIV